MARNAASILTSDIANRATTFVLYALVARHLGTYEFGQMSLALTFFFTSQVFAVAGLRTLLTREVSRQPDRAGDYLRNGSAVVVIASVLSFLAVACLVLVLGYSGDTATAILLLTLGVLPFSLSAVCEGIFQAYERMKYIAYAHLPVNAVKVGGALLLLARGHGVISLILLLLATHWAVAVIQWWFIRRRIKPPRARTDLRFAIRLAKSTSPFMGIDGLMAVIVSANLVILSQFATENEVGLYSAASQLLVPAGLVFTSVALSAFPQMCRKFETDAEGMRRITSTVLWLLVALALPIAVGLYTVPDLALLFLYREPSFLGAVPVLQIVAWTLVLRAMTAALGQVLLAASRETTNLRITGVNAVASIVLGILLTAQYGLIGAAVAALLVQVINVGLHLTRVTRFVNLLALSRLLWRPALASACMAAVLTAMGPRSLAVAVSVGAVVYTSLLVGLEFLPSGESGPLRRTYRALSSG